MNVPVKGQTVFPSIRYRDPDTAIKWLAEAFGLVEQVVYREDSGSVKHAELGISDNLIMLGRAEPDGWMGGDVPSPLASTTNLYVVVDDPDSLYDQAKAAGARIVRELTDESYGSREFSARDAEGNLWSFGTYQPPVRTG
ncbi:MAG: VOC family protein [Solirubrobacterales bacterium]